MTGVRSVILGQFSGVPFGETALEANAAGLPADARAELEAVLDAGDGFSESTMNDLTDAAWREIRELTAKRGKLRAIHCLENAGYRDLSLKRTGRGDLARALEQYDPHLVVHMTVAEPWEIALLAASGKPAAINPRANANLGLPMPPVRALMESGANLLLGTDNGLLNSPNLFAELDFTYKLAKSQFGDAVNPDPLAILRMATSNIGALLGSDHPGRLEAGLPASFVVLDFNQPHLRATRHIPASIVTRVTPEDVLATYLAGRPLYEAPAFAGSGA
jgi:5-methylthioadenosine/S-adenosylhomocysteine deaminase